MFIIVGKVDVDPGHRDEYLGHADVAMRATREEPGCLEYVISADRLDPARINLYERWTDWESLKAHLKSAHIAAYQSAVASLGVKSREFIQYEVSSERTLG